MARYRCRVCVGEGTFEYEGTHACPRCGSRYVQTAVGIEELPDDAPLVAALSRLDDEERR